MMGHVKAIGIKLVFTMVILLSLFAMFDTITFQQVLLISFIVTGVTYIVGDLLLLPSVGNIITTIIDFGLFFLSVWILAALFIEQTATIVLASAIAAYFFSVCEALFHAYMKEKVLPKKLGVVIPFPNMRLQTEFSKELYSNKDDKE